MCLPWLLREGHVLSWRDATGLLQHAEPIGAALNLLRFLLLRSQDSALVSRSCLAFQHLSGCALDLCSYSMMVNRVQESIDVRHVVDVLLQAIGTVLTQLDGQLDLVTQLTLQRAQEVATRVIELLR